MSRVTDRLAARETADGAGLGHVALELAMSMPSGFQIPP